MAKERKESFAVLNLTVKRTIFWSLVVLFSIYSVLVYKQGTRYQKGATAYTESAQHGKLVFQKFNCIACHQIYGLGGYMGPDLTNVMTATGKGQDYSKAFITAGTVKMPKFDISENELVELLDYLEYVGLAGHYPVTDYRTTWYGNIKEKSEDHE